MVYVRLLCLFPVCRSHLNSPFVSLSLSHTHTMWNPTTKNRKLLTSHCTFHFPHMSPPPPLQSTERHEGFTEDSESKRKHQTTSLTLSAQEWMEYRLPHPALAFHWPGGIPWAAKECRHWPAKKHRGCLNWTKFKLPRNLISEWLTGVFLSGHWLKNK